MFKVVTLDMIAAPNSFSFADGNRWEIKQRGAGTFWGQLYIIDALSERRYIPAVGSTLQITFWRADKFLPAQQPGTLYDEQALPGEFGFPQVTFTSYQETSQSIVVVATWNAQDPSLFSFDLTMEQVEMIMSGTVKFCFTENSVPVSWAQNWGVRRTPVRPGA